MLEKLFGVRLIVDHRGESLGCGFVEFASAKEAKKVRVIYRNDEKYLTCHFGK